MATSANERTFRDVFQKIATGHATSAGTAITSGTQQALTVSIPDVDLSGLWTVLAIVPATPGSLAGVVLKGNVTAAGTVTVYLQNLSGSTETPPAMEITVIAAKIDKRYTLV